VPLRHAIAALGADYAVLPQWIDAALGCSLCFPIWCAARTMGKQFRLAAFADEAFASLSFVRSEDANV
jgi:hypothetical protein